MPSFTAIDPRDADKVLDVTFKVTNPGHPGNTYGLPEDCFPPEPMEIEIHHAHDEAGVDVLDLLTADQAEAIESEIVENFEFPDFDDCFEDA